MADKILVQRGGIVSMVQTGRQAIESAVTRFFHMCNTHCPGNLAPMLTQDVELLDDQTANGPEQVNGYFKWLWESYPDLSFKVGNILIDGSSVAVETSFTGGPNGGGGRCFVFQLRGDLIRRIRAY